MHNQARLLQALGIAVDVIPPYPAIDIALFPLSARLAPRPRVQPKVVIHLGAGNRFRDWGEDHFAALVAAPGAPTRSRSS